MNPHRCRRVGCRGITLHARLLSSCSDTGSLPSGNRLGLLCLKSPPEADVNSPQSKRSRNAAIFERPLQVSLPRCAAWMAWVWISSSPSLFRNTDLERPSWIASHGQVHSSRPTWPVNQTEDLVMALEANAAGHHPEIAPMAYSPLTRSCWFLSPSRGFNRWFVKNDPARRRRWR